MTEFAGMRRYKARPQAVQSTEKQSVLALAPTSLEISALFALLMFYLIPELIYGEQVYPFVNMVGPLIMVAILGFGGWRLIRADGANIWTALLWFRLSTSVYFGIGTYAIFIMNDYTRAYVVAFFQFLDENVFKLNLVVTLSAIVVLVSARLYILGAAARKGRKPPRRSVSHKANEERLLTTALLFLVGGGGIDYFVVMPYRLGWISWELPGAIQNLAKIGYVGIFLITLWSLTHTRRLLFVISAFVVVDLIFQSLTFSKSGVLLVLIMYLMAFLWHKVSFKRLLVAALLVVGTYASLVPIVSYARYTAEQRYGENKYLGFGERLQILVSYFDDSSSSMEQYSEHQNSLSRLSYVNMGTFAIKLYDSGRPANWPEMLPAVFVPRFLWPEKPIITDVGIDFNELAMGNRTSSSAAGLFADAYWAAGWWGVIIFMLFYGLMLGVLTVVATDLMRESRWIFFPLVLQAMFMGFRTDGVYIADVAGVSVYVVYYYVAIYTLERFMNSSRFRRKFER